jgi:hypothetical protein
MSKLQKGKSFRKGKASEREKLQKGKSFRKGKASELEDDVQTTDC